MPKCIRCGKCVDEREDFLNWILLPCINNKSIECDVRKVNRSDISTDRAFFDIPNDIVWDGCSMLGLCPDCRIYSKPEDNVWLDPEHPGVRMLNQHEHDIETLGGCLEAMEKRTAKLERELDRLWEVMRCMGEK